MAKKAKKKDLLMTFRNFDKKHLRNLAKQQKVIDYIYGQALNDSIMASMFVKPKKDSAWSWEDYPTAKKKLDQAVADFVGQLETTITEGNQREWLLATEKNNEVIDMLVKGGKVPEAIVEGWKEPHLEALEAFQQREAEGMNLSERVWKLGEQMKQELELSLELGIGEGKSAADLSRDVRMYLQNPKKLFRRVRDEFGNLRLSKAAAAYHPGQGVYRSAYKNALRLTATENNMAYHEADHNQWSQLDFVIGYRVQLSNNHTLNDKPFHDICDILQGDYPKTFRFKGWHPFCRCLATPILADWDEQLKVMKMQKEGKDISNYRYKGEVRNMPKAFTEWVENNAERIKAAKSKPYFIKDNYIEGDIDKGYTWDSAEYMHQQQLAATQQRQEARTEEQKEDIKQRWADRNKLYKEQGEKAKAAVTASAAFPHDINTEEINNLIARGQYSQAAKIAADIENSVEGLKKAVNSIADIYPNAEAMAKDYSIAYLNENAKAIKSNMAMLTGKTLQEKETILATLEGNSPDIQKEYYKTQLNEVRIDIKLENMKLNIDNVVSYSKGSPIMSFKDMTAELEAAVKARNIKLVEQLLKISTKMRVLVDRYEELAAYKTQGKTFPGMVKAAAEALEKGDMTAALEAIKKAEDEMERLEARKLYLRAQAAQKKAAAEAAKKAAEEAAKNAPKEPAKLLSECTYEELKKQLGSAMPNLLKHYEDSVKRLEYTAKKYKDEASDIERKFKAFFADCDFAHRTKCTLQQISDNGILNNLQTTAMGLPEKYPGYDRCRRAYGHFAFGFQKDKSYVQPSNNLEDGEYYRCGTPCSKDLYEGYVQNTAKGYGKTQILLRKDKVVTTFTFDNSLGEDTIPSLVGDPKVCSLDKMDMKSYQDKEYKDVTRVRKGASYVELQYTPLHGKDKIMPTEMAAIILPEKPTTPISQKLLKTFYEAGTDLYYIDSTNAKCVLIQKGKPQQTIEERAAIRHNERDAQLKKQGITAEERVQQLLKERAENIAAAQKEAKDFLSDTTGYVNKDSAPLIQKAQDRLKAGNAIGAYTIIEEVKRQHTLDTFSYMSMQQNIPNAKDLHQRFTMAELQAANQAITSKVNWIENYSSDLDWQLQKFGKEVSKFADPANQKFSTWEIARDAYKAKMAELTTKIKGRDTLAAINNAEAFKTTSQKYKKLIQEAKDLHAQGKFDEAQDILLQADGIKTDLENKRAAVKAIKFAKEAFTQAAKDEALWFKNDNNPQLSFNQVDAIMTKYAEDVWAKLTDEQKHVAYLYTSGSRYINEPFFTHYGAVKISPVDGSVRSSQKDINTLTQIIDKCKPLEQAMWVQHAEDASAFYGRFGVNLYMTSDLSSIIGKEAVNAPFMSTSCAKNSYFTKKNLRGDMAVVMSIYLPAGTKGLYVEPFAHYGDGKTYGDESTRYGKSAVNWNGKSRQEAGKAAGDQVEFLLQRGAKLKITKAEYKDGRWYIDADLIEQTALTDFKGK